MTSLLAILLSLLAMMLLGVLSAALRLWMRHGDTNACYPLYAVRDRLVASVVFEGVPEDDAWFAALHWNVNAILRGASMLSGPASRPLALAIGSLDGGRDDLPSAGKLIRPPRHVAPPAALEPILDEMKSALAKLSDGHGGFALHRSAKERLELRRKRQAARELRSLLAPA